MDFSESPDQDSTDVLPRASWERTIGVLVSLAFLCAGCASTRGVAEHANIQGSLPQGAQSAVVRVMPMQPAAIKSAGNLSPTDVPPLFARYLKDALALRQTGWQIRLADEESATHDQEITISTELLEIDGGSAALRFWIGLNTGKAFSTVRVSLLDKAGKDLANIKISEQTVCPVGACTESNEDTIRRNLQSLAADVAEFVADPAGYDKKKGSSP
jgi:hypothetical protein